VTGVMEKLKTIKFDAHTRIILIVVFFVVALAVTVLGALVLKIDMSEVQKIRDEVTEEFNRFNDPRFIFGNNLLHTLIMFIPIIGPFWGSFVLFNTGTVIAIISIAEGVPSILTFLLLFFTPIFWLEFGVYSVAMAQSVVLFLQILRHRGKKETVRTCILVTICALILLISAVVEWVMINM
jgi:hypothetical protein